MNFADLTHRTRRNAEWHREVKIIQLPAHKPGGLYKTCERGYIVVL